jgi:hypothetical protein
MKSSLLHYAAVNSAAWWHEKHPSGAREKTCGVLIHIKLLQVWCAATFDLIQRNSCSHHNGAVFASDSAQNKQQKAGAKHVFTT